MKYAAFLAAFIVLSVLPVFAQETLREEVKCVFSGSDAVQKCYEVSGGFSCSGSGTCVMAVSGPRGSQLTWKSSCGGYAYTTMDGQNDYAEFKCASDQTETIKKPCIQVITPATDGNNCKEFPTPCDVPDGWKKVSSCSSHENPTVAQIQTYEKPAPVSSLPFESFSTECPSFANVELTEEALAGPVINFITSRYPHLAKRIASCDWKEDELKAEISKILDSDYSWKNSCAKMRDYASECSKKSAETCTRFDSAIGKCEGAYENCRRYSEKVQQDQEEARKRMDDLRRKYEEADKNRAKCGNGICESGEDYKNCFSDCPIYCEPLKCGDGSYVKAELNDGSCKYPSCPIATAKCPEYSKIYEDGTTVKCYTASTGECKCDKYAPQTTTTVTQTTISKETTTTVQMTNTSQETTVTQTTAPTPTGQVSALSFQETSSGSSSSGGGSSTGELITPSSGSSQSSGGGSVPGKFITQPSVSGYGFGGFDDSSFFDNVPKCYAEEQQCQRLREMREKCTTFVDKCASNCGRLEDMSSKCMTLIGNKEELASKLVAMASRMCKLKDYKFEVNDDKITDSETLPTIVVTDPALSSDQEKKLSGFAVKYELIHASKEYSIYRALIKASSLENVRSLDFVNSVKVDHITRTLEKTAKKDAPQGEQIAAIEGVKSFVDETTASVLAEKQDNILDASAKAFELEKKEKEKGIGFALLKFLGFKAKEEEKEASELNDYQKSIDDAASSLEKIANGEDNIEAKAVLLEQASKLKEKAKSLKELSEKKKNSARGLLSFLFG
ncbi:MAG: hypothetical protein HZB68_01300 [Candidatus Aenigmarchaeota archaeon]|nr:hypothetical protein [Candidatus Aenigmarchaeota archaeon]